MCPQYNNNKKRRKQRAIVPKHMHSVSVFLSFYEVRFLIVRQKHLKEFLRGVIVEKRLRKMFLSPKPLK
jgi:hypothetical protein